MAEWSSDEALARQLQAQEEIQYAQAQRMQQMHAAAQGRSSAQLRFQAQLEQGLAQVIEYEDSLLQAQALSVLPDDILQSIGSMGLEKDRLARRLLAFFKNGFFTWVNNVTCAICNSDDTAAQHAFPPETPEEIEGRAHVVEVYCCKVCKCTTRFPRYNAPAKLLETRKGRCGEWANAFTLLCRAVGLEVRYVKSWADHVFTEYYSDHEGRWLHMDPCENEYDKPLLYEAGWGKSWSYVVGFSRYGVTDVSLRYSKDHKATRLRQQQLLDPNLASGICGEYTSHLRNGLEDEEARLWRERDEVELRELLREEHHPEQPLPGRQTGSTAWRAARGELGTSLTATGRGSEQLTPEKLLATDPRKGDGSMPIPAVDSNSTMPIETAPLASSLPMQAILATPVAQPAVAISDPVLGPGLSESEETGMAAATHAAGDQNSSAKSKPEEDRMAPAAPRKAMSKSQTTGTNSPSATPISSLSNLSLASDPTHCANTLNSASTTLAQAASICSKTAAASAGPAKATGPHQSSRVSFADRVKIIFSELMAGGDITPNQAAVQALKKVQAENLA